jgi:RHS repeat-associated protein
VTESGVSSNNLFQFIGRECDATQYDSVNLYQICYMRARYYLPTWGRFLSRDPLEFSASTNFYEYANNNPVDFSDPTGTQPAPGGVGFGAGGGGGGGGGPGGIADYNNYGAGASSDMAIQSDSPTQPLGVHGVGVGLVLGRQFSVGQSAGGVYYVQEDEEDEGPETLEGYEEEQIRLNIRTAEILDEEMGRPRWAHTPGGFLGWLKNLQNPKGQPVTTGQANAIVREARRLGISVRGPEQHSPPNPWTKPHLNLGETGRVHVLVPLGYSLPQ